MMDVKYIARLAKLNLDEKTEEKMKGHFKKMLEYVKILDELNLDGIDPLTYPHTSYQRMRDDVPKSGLERDEALKDAPDSHLYFFRVPSPLKGLRKGK